MKYIIGLVGLFFSCISLAQMHVYTAVNIDAREKPIFEKSDFYIEFEETKEIVSGDVRLKMIMSSVDANKVMINTEIYVRECLVSTPQLFVKLGQEARIEVGEKEKINEVRGMKLFEKEDTITNFVFSVIVTQE